MCDEGRVLLYGLLSQVLQLLEKASEAKQTTPEVSREVKREGKNSASRENFIYCAGALTGSQLVSAMANIGEFDARYREEGEEAWIASATKFLGSVQMMNLIAFQGRLSSESERLFRTVNECKEILDQSWNADLPRCPVSDSKEQAKADKSTKDGREGTYREVSLPRQLEADKKIKCREGSCMVLFSSQKAMKNHFLRKHPESHYTPPRPVLDRTSGRLLAVANRRDKVRNMKGHLIQVYSSPLDTLLGLQPSLIS